jgi:hypothetical protein
LGTDLDNLIIAIDCCKSANGLQRLKNDMREDPADILNKNGFHTVHADVLPDDIYYNNGQDFIPGR